MQKKMTVRDYMVANLVTFTAETDMLNAIAELVKRRISGAPVVDKHGNLIGILSEKDCMQIALNASYHDEMGGKVKDYMSKDVKTVHADMSIVDLAKRFLEEPQRRYAVFNDENHLVGQISRRDVLRALLERNGV